MITFFKIYVSLYHLIDLLTPYFNKLIYFTERSGLTECSGLIVIYLFFHKNPCAISKNSTHLYDFFTKPRISNQSLVFE